MTPNDPPGVVIHPAKLPMRIPPEQLHLRPAADGSVACDPEGAGWRYLSFRAFGLGDGETMRLDRPEQETAIVTISGGGVEVARDGDRSRSRAGRPSSRACPGAPTCPPAERSRSRVVRCPGCAPSSRSPRRR